MGDGRSIETIGELRERMPAMHVVVVSLDDTPGFAQQALAAGATCYVLKDLAETDLPAAVRAASKGEEYLSEPVAARLRTARQALTEGRLSARETEVLRLIALGYTTIEIAHQLRLSPRTIETHRAHIYRKLELPNPRRARPLRASQRAALDVSTPTEASSAPNPGAGELRCYRCGDVIGAYEPMIALIAGTPVRTSRVALGVEQAIGKVCFHVDCFPRRYRGFRRACEHALDAVA